MSFRAPVVRLIKTVYENIGIGVVASSLAYRYYVSHVEETPVTGRKRFMICSNEKVEKKSEIAFKKVLDESNFLNSFNNIQFSLNRSWKNTLEA